MGQAVPQQHRQIKVVASGGAACKQAPADAARRHAPAHPAQPDTCAGAACASRRPSWHPAAGAEGRAEACGKAISSAAAAQATRRRLARQWRRPRPPCLIVRHDLDDVGAAFILLATSSVEGALGLPGPGAQGAGLAQQQQGTRQARKGGWSHCASVSGEDGAGGGTNRLATQPTCWNGGRGVTRSACRHALRYRQGDRRWMASRSGSPRLHGAPRPAPLPPAALPPSPGSRPGCLTQQVGLGGASPSHGCCLLAPASDDWDPLMIGTSFLSCGLPFHCQPCLPSAPVIGCKNATRSRRHVGRQKSVQVPQRSSSLLLTQQLALEGTRRLDRRCRLLHRL